MIKIKCEYFKKSGKYYTSGEGEFSEELFKDCIYPREYGEKLRELALLPGLNSGTWLEGYFTIDNGSYTELVMPVE